MLLFTNPGSNLPRSAVERYGVVLTAQQIVASGTAHDTRLPIPLSQVESWTHAPGEYPYVVGTTAPEMTALLVEHLARDPEILVLTTSRKIIKTYDATVAAIETVKARPKFASARVRVIDSGVTDVGAGLLVLVAGEAMRAGKSFHEVCSIVERAKTSLRMYAYLHSLEWSVRGGRVGFMRAWLANALDVRPFITFKDGEIAEGGRVKLSTDRMKALAEVATKGLEGKKVWAAIAHGNATTDAEALRRAVGERCDVTFSFVLPLSASIYLHAGPGGVAVGLCEAPHDVPTPPSGLFPESGRMRVG